MAGGIDAAWDVLDSFNALPSGFKAPVMDCYRNEYGTKGAAAAKQWMDGVGQTVTVRGAGLAASDNEICAAAVRASDTVRAMLNAATLAPVEVLRGSLVWFCREEGVTVPDKVSLQGIIARTTDKAWWRRQYRRMIGRKVEGFARKVGMVQRAKAVYASDETVARHQEQQRRNLASLEGTEAVNSEGEVFILAELAKLGVSNPSVRFAELMVRVRGMEVHAKANQHEALFITGTAPSRMHAVIAESGKQNRLFDDTCPKEAQQWIGRQWARCRAALARLQCKYYGVRVCEPHHDGTPHWHMLVFIKPALAGGRSAVGRFMAIFRRYMLRGDWVASKKADLVQAGRASGLTIRAATAEAKNRIHTERVEARRAEKDDSARRQRACDFKVIDWNHKTKSGAPASAAGYLVKYLAKNISGQCIGEDEEAGKPATETAGRVLAWASCWGIRQFQVVGGPPVGVWRELRRIKEQPEQLELFSAWQATGSKAEERKPDWAGYIAAQGGIECKRADRPVQLWKLAEPGRLTKYHDEAGARVAGVMCAGIATRSRDTVWVLRQMDRAHGTKDVSERFPEVDKKRHGKKSDGFDLARASRRVWGSAFASPRTRVTNCTPRASGAWPGLAASMASWNELGNKKAVLEIFNKIRSLKNV